MNTIHLQVVQACQESLHALEKMAPVAHLQKKVEDLDAKIAAPGLWTDPKTAGSIMKERAAAAETLSYLTQAKDHVEFYNELITTTDNGLSDKDMADLLGLHTRLHMMVFQEMLKDPVDNTPAIISISAGAGGLEAANWVTMLLRMYVRYANNQGFKMEILDEKPSEEHSSICTDSVSIRVEGHNAYGFFKGESGVHRLIRNSPFNAGDARQTSFAAVQVTPDIEDTIDIKIDEKDIDVIAIARGGSGGQNQNKVASAIRLRHFPTGINILVKSERDFHKNKATAFKMLKSKLYQLEMDKKKEEQNKNIDAMSDISFGHQIRTVTLMPYTLVKDHRTNFETSDAQGFLDGDIQDFMIAYLQQSRK